VMSCRSHRGEVMHLLQHHLGQAVRETQGGTARHCDEESEHLGM
jgi:hypothetical protein